MTDNNEDNASKDTIVNNRHIAGIVYFNSVIVSAESVSNKK